MSSATAEEQAPMLGLGEVQEEPLLGARGRGRRSRRGLALGLAAALAAAASSGALLASSGGRGLRASAGGRDLARKNLVGTSEDGASIEANADALSKAADAANAKLQADREQVKALREQADGKMKDGTDEVKTAEDNLAAAKEAQAKAEAMQKEAQDQAAKAQAMLTDAQNKEVKAQALKDQGNHHISSGKDLSSQAEAITGREEQEAANAATAIKAEAGALQTEAKYLADNARAAKEAADKALKEATAKLEAAQAKAKEAGEVLEKATLRLNEASAREKKDREAAEQAKAAQAAAATAKATAKANQKQGEGDLAIATKDAATAKAEQAKVKKEAEKVASLERRSGAWSAAHRVCLDVEGARLRDAGDATEFAPLAMDKDVSDWDKCKTWCRQHEGCEQAVFSSWDKHCSLFAKATTEVQEWNSGYTSTLCADESQKHKLKDMLDEVATQKPEIADPVQCSWSGEDCASTKCCNEVSCSWDYKTCTGYSCYQNGGGSQCMQTAAWNTGVIIGGARQTRTVQPAGDSTTKQGTSLFCFMVVNWKSTEEAIANNIKDKKLGIFECDAQTILSGWEVPKTPWATWMNADAFVKLWQQLQQSGEYLSHDWTVKVDADTVFFPNMLRMHLDSLKVPQGSRAYVKNINYKFQFNGALEVYTREAVKSYFEKGGVCADKLLKVHDKAGEDFFMKTCMDGIGVDSVEDFMLLRDTTCGAECGSVDAKCGDGWVAAYHAYRDVAAWTTCHDDARAAQLAGGHKPTDGLVNAAAPAATKDFPTVDGKDAKDARDLMQQATDLHSRLQPEAIAADGAAKDARKRIAAAEDLIKNSKATIVSATHNASDAQKAEAAAEKAVQEEVAKEVAAKKVAATQAATKAEGEREATEAQALVATANTAETSAEDTRKRAAGAEEKERSDIASLRFCLDLPGVRLKGEKDLNATPIVMQPNTSTPEDCRQWCQAHNSCKQSVYSRGNKGCYLFAEAKAEAVEFTAGYNSTYCGAWEEKDALKGMVDAVYKTMPYVPPVPNCAWAGDNCIESKCCANVPVPNWKFTEFQWYSCWKKDESFASCETGPAPGGWDGALLGHMGTREVPKAPDGVLTQGTSLFCFCVVVWSRPATKPFWSSEAELANNIKNTGRSIMKCDDHEFFEGAGLNAGGDGSSINNIDSFIGAWKKVHDDGRYLQHDWTVKVDADAVFFPDRLKMHIQSLRTPQGSRVYLRNINFKFEFLGALEIFTKEALQLYFENAWVCDSKVGHQGGEDYWMLACMDGIGVDHQTDHQLLNDKYAATGNCNDPWVVGFHFYKQVQHWNECYDAAKNSAKINGKDYWQWE